MNPSLIQGLIIATNTLVGFTLIAINTNWHTAAIIKPQPEKADGSDWIYQEVGTLVTNRSDVFIITNSAGIKHTNVWYDEQIESTNLYERFLTNTFLTNSITIPLKALPYSRKRLETPPLPPQ